MQAVRTAYRAPAIIFGSMRRLLTTIFSCSLLLLAACGEQRLPVEIRFAAYYADSEVSCLENSSGIGLSDLRFFVHDVRLQTADGGEARLTLTPEPGWQTDSVALIDLENAGHGCINGSLETNIRLQGTVPAGTYDGLSFRVGVPDVLNHADPLYAEAPLSQTAMHWHWRSGYKFMRAGVRQGDDGAWLHLGSAGCQGTIGNLSGCERANRPTVRLPGFDAQRHAVALDLQRLFAASSLRDGLIDSCQMGPDEELCDGIAMALGLDLADGSSAGPAKAFKTVDFRQ